MYEEKQLLMKPRHDIKFDEDGSPEQRYWAVQEKKKTQAKKR